MKRVQAEYPYNEYWLYVVFHKSENRRQANLILKTDTKRRTTISYARYLVSVSLGRFLEKDEQVDHIDNDCTNDDLVNLQVLSPTENFLKKNLNNWKETLMPLTCSNCGTTYQFSIKEFRYKKKKGQQRFFCSRKCVYEGQRKCC